MKKVRSIFKGIVSALLVFVMVFAMLPLSSFKIAVAAEDDDLPILDFLHEYNAKSSTAIKSLSGMMNASENAKQYSALLKRAGGYAAILGGSIEAIRGAVSAYDKNDKWYENIWNIGVGAISGFLGLSSPKTSTSALVIQYDMAEMKSMIKSMQDDIDAINEKLDNLEELVQTNFAELSNKIVNKIQETEYKNFLNEFTQVNNRSAFSYYTFFKPDLNQRYNELLEAFEGENEENIKQAYDNLYLVAKQSEQLYYYVSGESRILTGKQSIQDILYDYSILSTEEDFELTCVEFAEDVNSTFIFAQYCLSLCYNYQLLYAQMNEKTYDAYYSVQLGKTAVESIQYSSISSKITDMLRRQDIVTKNIAKYICKVLRLNGEFDYTSRNIHFGTIPYTEISESNIYGSIAYKTSNGSKVYYRTNNHLQKGDVIQICEMPDAYIDMFDMRFFDISVSNENAQFAPDGNVKVVGVSGSSFDVIYSYAGEECYRSTYNIVSNFSGGLGIDSAPYLISTPNDFNRLRTVATKCYYLLVNDINFNNTSLPIIGFASGYDGGFGGVLDGGGYKVYNYQITGWAMSNYQFNNSLFPIVKQGAIIKNLTVGDMNCQTYNGYSVQYYCYYGPSGFSLTAYNGILSGINEGTISNCSIQNVKIDINIVMSMNLNYYWSLDACVGGFAAENRGIISHSAISNCIMTGKYQSNQAPCRLYIGGISGWNRSMISNCFSLDNSINAATTAASALLSTQSLIYGGNIIGQNNGAYNTVFGEHCSLTMTPSGTHTRNYYYGVQSGYLPGASADTRYMENYGWMTRGDGRAVLDNNLAKTMCDFTLPHKTVYYMGEPLNLTGLELYYGNAIQQDLLGISNKSQAYNYQVSGYEPNVIGAQTVTLTYNDLFVSFDVTVLCPHEWENGIETIKPSHMGYGTYTEICTICGETRESAIEKLSEHVYNDWTNLNDKQHQRVCECGDIEKENHHWDEGELTKPATYISEGIMTYTCDDCGATHTDIIPKLAASGDTSTITVDNASSKARETLEIGINLVNNPGITSMRICVHYSSELLKLTNVSYNSAMGGQSVPPASYEILNGSVILYWTDGFNDYTEDGVFVTLTFEVSANAIAGDQTEIRVTYEPDDIYDANENNVAFATKSGRITFANYLPGDINGDGVVNSKDVTRLMRYLAGWDVEVIEAALDVNGDGVINTKDTTRLMRYLAGWNVDIY